MNWIPLENDNKTVQSAIFLVQHGDLSLSKLMELLYCADREYLRQHYGLITGYQPITTNDGIQFYHKDRLIKALTAEYFTINDDIVSIKKSYNATSIYEYWKSDREERQKGVFRSSVRKNFSDVFHAEKDKMILGQLSEANMEILQNIYICRDKISTKNFSEWKNNHRFDNSHLLSIKDIITGFDDDKFDLKMINDIHTTLTENRAIEEFFYNLNSLRKENVNSSS